MYQFPWPRGTVLSSELPTDVLASLMLGVSTTGILDPSMLVQQTATEGPFISIAGYKVRVTIEPTSPTTQIVRLA